MFYEYDNTASQVTIHCRVLLAPPGAVGASTSRAAVPSGRQASQLTGRTEWLTGDPPTSEAAQVTETAWVSSAPQGVVASLGIHLWGHLADMPSI